MIVKEDLLSKLRRYFVLNLYEVKIWTALLSRGVATAGELSDIANVPRSRSYDVLESLERKGFVIMKLGKPIKYIAVPPTEVLERVKKNLSDEAHERVSRLDELKTTDVLAELNSLHTQGTTSQGLMRKVEGFKPVFEKLKKKGVKIRIAAPLTKETKDAVKDISDVAEVRHNDQKARFCIVDGKELVFMIMDDANVHPTYDVGIWVNTPFFAGALESMFNIAWKSMKGPNFK
jgi:sugar-specific transcriptional regulator TrmB